MGKIRKPNERPPRHPAVEKYREAQGENPFGYRNAEHIFRRHPERLVEKRVVP